jgi:hypothetical protein
LDLLSNGFDLPLHANDFCFYSLLLSFKKDSRIGFRESPELPGLLPGRFFPSTTMSASRPWHPDIAWTGEEPISTETRQYGRKLLHARFGRGEVIKLLECIDANGIDRGSVGQSVAAVISCVDEIGPILAGVSRNRSLDMRTRELATLIIAQREGTDAIPIATELALEGSDFAREITSELRRGLETRWRH